MVSVAGPQLLIPCSSYFGSGRVTWDGSGLGVGVRLSSIAGEVGVGGSGVKVAKGVDGKGVGIFPTGFIVF